MSEILEVRRRSNQERLKRLRGDLSDAENLAGSNACVYLTGSFARGEASQYSDLDLFIVGKSVNGERKLLRLEEICIKADLIEATQKHGFPRFSKDGKYLVHHTQDDLVGTLGRPEDDVSNTFTARLLLLLESRPLLCDSVYQDIISNVVAAYWRDYEDHKTSFMPAFLANDILRLWRTLCINYEAHTETDPADKKAERKLKNYKLKHSRLLTCYSGLLSLLSAFQSNQTVHPSDVLEMVALSPTERLERLATTSEASSVKDGVDVVLRLYERFLNDTAKPEDEMIAEFLDRNKAREYAQNANELGDRIYDLLRAVGDKSKFFRLLVV